MRDFLLGVSGTSVKRFTLGQRIGGEPERETRELEKSFRNCLHDALTTWYSEAVLATHNSPKRRALPSLPAKTVDLTKYFDEAKLADRQRECMSLKCEYGFSAYAIAKRLNLHISTVNESLASGEKRIERFKNWAAREKRAATSPSSYQDAKFRK